MQKAKAVMCWLASFTVRVSETEIDTHHIIAADSEQLAERGAQEMGRAWWKQLEEEMDGCCWRFPRGEVRFFSLVPLTDAETHMLMNLKFIDRWLVNVSLRDFLIADEYGNPWCDFRR